MVGMDRSEAGIDLQLCADIPKVELDGVGRNSESSNQAPLSWRDLGSAQAGSLY